MHAAKRVLLYLETKFYIINIHHKGGCSISVEARWQKTHYKPTPVKIWNEIIISTPQWPCLAWLGHCVLNCFLRGHFLGRPWPVQDQQACGSRGPERPARRAWAQGCGRGEGRAGLQGGARADWTQGGIGVWNIVQNLFCANSFVIPGTHWTSGCEGQQRHGGSPGTRWTSWGEGGQREGGGQRGQGGGWPPGGALSGPGDEWPASPESGSGQRWGEQGGLDEYVQRYPGHQREARGDKDDQSNYVVNIVNVIFIFILYFLFLHKLAIETKISLYNKNRFIFCIKWKPQNS